MFGRIGRFKQVNKIADYTISAAKDTDHTVFTTFGATTGVTFTLPAPSKALKGVCYQFVGGADTTTVVATGTADTLLVLADAAADSVTLGTAAALLGGRIQARCLENATGYQWWAECTGNVPGTTDSVNLTKAT